MRWDNLLSGPLVLMLIDVRRAHFYSPARRKVFVQFPEEAGTGKSKVGRLLRSTHGCRDTGVHWVFAICQVMIAIGFVQGRASPCIYRHLEKQRVGVHGDDFVLLGYIVNVRLRIEESLDPLDTTTGCKAFECWAGSWNGPPIASLGRQILDMQSLRLA